uniref:Uncharacterized protein n=1 Tax=Rhizophora mucronata TaxID=61149 RepID=A0A2P2K0G8_RHIMU
MKGNASSEQVELSEQSIEIIQKIKTDKFLLLFKIPLL